VAAQQDVAPLGADVEHLGEDEELLEAGEVLEAAENQAQREDRNS